MHLTLVVPELLWPEPDDRDTLEKLDAPALEWLLARGRCTRAAPRPAEEALAACFGTLAETPFGALRLLGERQPLAGLDARRGWWLCADPVHLRFHHERIILADAGAFALDMEEAHALSSDLNREFADLGVFHVAESRRWYLRLHEAQPHPALPLSTVAGRRMDGELQEDAQAAPLRRWLNEIQMFLHGHPVNARRAGSGQPAVNSLWLWGGGQLESPAGTPGREAGFSTLWADDPLARGLAIAHRTALHDGAPGLATVLAEAVPESRHLVYLDTLLAPVLYEDGAAWRQALADLEAAWFAPLRTALGGKVRQLDLIAPTIYGHLTWQLNGIDRWKLWRRPQPLSTTLRTFAA